MRKNLLLDPGIAVMRWLAFSHKIALIGFLAAMPVLVVFWLFFFGSEPAAAFRLVVNLCALDAMALVYCLIALHVSATQDVEQMVRTVERMLEGDMRQAPMEPRRDELGRVLTAMGELRRAVSAMVANVRSNAAFVVYASRSLAHESQDLADRTEQQASNLEQTAASVEQLSSTVQENAHNAASAKDRAMEVRDGAERSAATMAEAVRSVEAMQGSARRMDEIVGVIDGLAFQTNILALNAAVEAARAGESGRGFAVVASEVRSLAQRSAEASKEIRQLISNSSKQIAQSVQQIHAAGGSIEQVVAGIRDVANNMAQISHASAEQSTGLHEISASVSQLDEITQRNAHMVDSGVAKARDMEGRANTLVGSVASYRLQQGSPEEALELVERAAAHRQRAAGEAYLRDISDPSQGFFDRDMYVFVLDREGRYLAFGGNPSKVGTRVQDVPGIDGAALLQTIQRQVSKEPGWVEYDITNPTTGTVQTKMSYVQALDDWSLGCGVYKNLLV